MFIKLALLSAAFFSLAAPGQLRRESSEFVLSPDAATGSLKAECKASSSGECHFVFTIGAEHPALSVLVGKQVTVQGVIPKSEYCSGVNSVAWSSCSRTPLPDHRSTVKNNRVAVDAD